MNSLKGFGLCALLAAFIFGLTRVPNASHVFLALSIVIIATCTVTFAASIRRSRRDRRLAGVTGRRRRA
ncbi:hypothetical protein [Kitasatospora sp. NPDC088783]|uniref:hypothetical protein n=1 Tax=Kitasatospora sp. NPDC088783 TaxID=3364077 RepID=UPI0037FD9F26